MKDIPIYLSSALSVCHSGHQVPLRKSASSSWRGHVRLHTFFCPIWAGGDCSLLSLFGSPFGIPLEPGSPFGAILDPGAPGTPENLGGHSAQKVQGPVPDGSPAGGATDSTQGFCQLRSLAPFGRYDPQDYPGSRDPSWIPVEPGLLWIPLEPGSPLGSPGSQGSALPGPREILPPKAKCTPGKWGWLGHFRQSSVKQNAA